MIKYHHNRDYNGGSPNLPEALNDRYWGQDWQRDFWYLLEKAGITIKDISTHGLLYKESDVTEGSSVTEINIPECVGYAKHQVTIQDEAEEWQVPALTKTVDIESIRIYSEAVVDFDISGATLDGSTTNYLKIAYAEKNERSRQKIFDMPTWNFEKGIDVVITADDTEPTEYEFLLATFVGNGTDTLTITQVEELLSDNTNLGTSSQIIPSQNAVKTYVDAKVNGILNENNTFTGDNQFTQSLSRSVGESGTAYEITPHGFIEYLGETSATWTAPAGVTEVVLNGVGQGGSGANAITDNRGGGGGGSGAWCRNLRVSVTPGTEYTITLSTTGDSTFFGVTLGKGGDASGATPGSGGSGSGGASNGYSGGSSDESPLRGGGGGGGIGGEGGSTDSTSPATGGGSGGAGSSATPGISYGSGYLSGAGGATGTDDFTKKGGIGAGGAGGRHNSFRNGGTSLAGGGGGGGGCDSSGSGSGGSGGPPFLRIEW